ncbi:cytochrome P450 [Friedmanniella endophytica]|uniref:Cytochrome P450 n=1 Tax=Microlunatus kandeliicorticis TaxID=1759536 RepID=A0A7W3P7B9_9ACTN|nr:cytochrome P450 [Microlunatus kandeliicorticis]MBA8795853.1 cytochrome P450 [Microlunatus kandeliicorticis]
MTSAEISTELPQLPFDQPNALEVAPEWGLLRAQAPLVDVRTPVGDRVWLVTRYEAAREIWSDPRFGRSHPEPERAARLSEAAVMGGAADNYATEQADHTRMRKLLVPAFSAKRMRALEARVQELVDGCVDDLVAARERALSDGDGTVDLHARLSFPLPVLVICELLGVPFADRAHFSELSDRMSRLDGGDDAQAARAEFVAYVGGLAEQKRRDPQPDVISDLVAAQQADPRFDDLAVAKLATGLLFAGHETTVTRIDYGMVLLLTRPEAYRRLAEEPGSVDGTVEEILRLAAPGGLGVLRYAHEDVRLGEQRIARGDAVVLSPTAPNRDPAVFERPGEFDPTRSPNPHLGFGHGAHFCIGASLARTELRTTVATLARRLPDLRLAVPVDALELRSSQLTGGLVALPVRW